MKHTFDYGKYTVQEENGTNFKALRHGEEWRDLTGDNLIASMLYDYDEVLARENRLKAHVDVLESKRPHWAKGFSSDSIAAQVQTSALSQVWKLLYVDDQTACMGKLQGLKDELLQKSNLLIEATDHANTLQQRLAAAEKLLNDAYVTHTLNKDGRYPIEDYFKLHGLSFVEDDDEGRAACQGHVFAYNKCVHCGLDYATAAKEGEA
mgnify:FL=1